MADSRLFKPIRIGRCELQHRMAMAPLTRYRADDDHVPTAKMIEYYRQRSAVPGTLLITEGTFISAEDGGYANVPGLYTEAQIEAWKPVTEAVHNNGSFIYCQLWALGRAASAEVAANENMTVVSADEIPLNQEDRIKPKKLSPSDIAGRVQNYAKAAQNAIAAGFDGVEIHGANGYLVDQFLQDVTNQRTDEYGGSVENRSRFAFNVAQAVSDAIGADRTAIRLSPWSGFNEMRMQDLVPQFSDIMTKLNGLGLAYVHLVMPRVAGGSDDNRDPATATDSPEFAFPLLSSVPVFLAGGFKPDSAVTEVDQTHPDKNIVVVFGRYFIANPDLPFRIQKGLELNPYNRKTFYTPQAVEGYTDYPFSSEFLAAEKHKL